jgi:hypothetical protein
MIASAATETNDSGSRPRAPAPANASASSTTCWVDAGQARGAHAWSRNAGAAMNVATAPYATERTATDSSSASAPPSSGTATGLTSIRPKQKVSHTRQKNSASVRKRARRARPAVLLAMQRQ